MPPIPKVAPQYTNGENPATLLANAIKLSSLGIDRSALTTAIAATQAKLVANAAVASKATAAADTADRRVAAALARADAAAARLDSTSGAVKGAVVELYTQGPAPLTVDPKAGAAAFYAQAYADSALSPYGILADHFQQAGIQRKALAEAKAQQKVADRQKAKAQKALAGERVAVTRLENELNAISASSATEVAADHMTLAGQAGKELLAASSLEFTPKVPIPAPVATTPIALTWAFAELGKPYVWAATGPNTFDCSGLTQFVWHAAGVNIPRVAADQDAWTVPVPLSRLLPGDLVFFGHSDIHHVGIYIGAGLMINAPHTGTVVQINSIWWSDLAGFGRVHTGTIPVPPHQPPSSAKPAPPAVVATAGPVPSQTKPPKGWKPAPGSTTPIRLGDPTPPPPPVTSTTTTSTTSTTVPVDPATTTVPDTATSVPDSTTTTATAANP